jgi:ribosomal protein L24
MEGPIHYSNVQLAEKVDSSTRRNTAAKPAAKTKAKSKAKAASEE